MNKAFRVHIRGDEPPFAVGPAHGVFGEVEPLDRSVALLAHSLVQPGRVEHGELFKIHILGLGHGHGQTEEHFELPLVELAFVQEGQPRMMLGGAGGGGPVRGRVGGGNRRREHETGGHQVVDAVCFLFLVTLLLHFAHLLCERAACAEGVSELLGGVEGGRVLEEERPLLALGGGLRVGAFVEDLDWVRGGSALAEIRRHGPG